MEKYAEIKAEIKELCSQGDKLYKAILPKSGTDLEPNNLNYFLREYDKWYTMALCIVKQILPERTQDFVLLYRDEKRKELNTSTYSISDALRTLSMKNKFYPSYASMCMLQQLNILKAGLGKFDSKAVNIQTILQADIFDSEIDSAKHLKSRGFLRAAGAICGVILEKHFFNVMESRGIQIKKKSPTIADYNDAFKDQVYDTIEWRRIQRLGDIRNLCDHHKDREPTADEVEELIAGVERVIKTVF